MNKLCQTLCSKQAIIQICLFFLRNTVHSPFSTCLVWLFPPKTLAFLFSSTLLFPFPFSPVLPSLSSQVHWLLNVQMNYGCLISLWNLYLYYFFYFRCAYLMYYVGRFFKIVNSESLSIDWVFLLFAFVMVIYLLLCISTI